MWKLLYSRCLQEFSDVYDFSIITTSVVFPRCLPLFPFPRMIFQYFQFFSTIDKLIFAYIYALFLLQIIPYSLLLSESFSPTFLFPLYFILFHPSYNIFGTSFSLNRSLFNLNFPFNFKHPVSSFTQFTFWQLCSLVLVDFLSISYNFSCWFPFSFYVFVNFRHFVCRI